MAHSLSRSNFGYASLPPPPRVSIRLLRIEYNASTKKTEFDLATFALGEAITYHAVYYIWGSNKRDRPLTLASR